MSSTEKETAEPPADLRDRPMQLACVFCERIRQGDYLGHQRRVVSFEPLSPVTPGHRLFVHQLHTIDAGVEPWIASQVFEIAAAFAWTQPDHYNLITSSGAPATQTIKHLHVHYVPRREGDGLHLPWTGKDRKSAAAPSSSVRFGVGL